MVVIVNLFFLLLELSALGASAEMEEEVSYCCQTMQDGCPRESGITLSTSCEVLTQIDPHKRPTQIKREKVICFAKKKRRYFSEMMHVLLFLYTRFGNSVC